MNLIPSKSVLMGVFWTLGTLAVINNVRALRDVKRIIEG